MVLLDAEVIDLLLDQLVMESWWDTFDVCIELKVLFDGQSMEQSIGLWAVAKVISDSFKILVDTLSFDHYTSISWLNFIGQTFEGCTLSGTIDT